MRGSHGPDRRDDLVGGIIPAHAGLTRKSMPSSSPVGDHPRACGAHPCFKLARKAERGSSPRMRGSPFQSLLHICYKGIIPAHAGLTWERLICAIAVRDHPRACGAHGGYIGSAGDKMGSSPRMRGSPLVARPWPPRPGIIPAHAGLTLVRHAAGILARDHPRACGAH